MKKRALSVLLAVAMVSTLLAGCGKGGSDSAAEADASATGGNVVKIGVYEPASGDNGAGGQKGAFGGGWSGSALSGAALHLQPAGA